jgi:hypothetical protein
LWSNIGLGALALVVGFGVAALPRLLASDTDEVPTKATRGNPRAVPTQAVTSRAATPPSPFVLGAPAAPEAPSAAAATPSAAVEGFLRAEQAGDFATSFGLLATADRTAQQSRAGWAAAHAEMPVIRGFALGAVRVGSRAEVDTTLVLKPELDEVVGLVPAAATATWIVLPEDGGWRVDFAESTLTPQFPSPDAAPAAARAWIDHRSGCHGRARARLLGVGSLADEVCAARGSVGVGTAIALEPGESSDPFLAAYGPDVFTWARVVPFVSPSRAGAVLAPLGPRWRVIGLVDLPSLSNDPQQGA